MAPKEPANRAGSFSSAVLAIGLTHRTRFLPAACRKQRSGKGRRTMALAGCVQVPTGQGQAPVLFYPHDDEPDMRTGNMGM
jgi:hypothetical protein